MTGLVTLPEVDYHRRPEFSSTMARIILRSPANLRHYLDSPRRESPTFDFGHVVHAGVLGVGLEIDVLDYPDWRTKAAREARDAAYAEGRVPMIERDYVQVRAAVEAVKEHELAGPIFAEGVAEQSAFAVDPETGVPLRARLDWITPDGWLIDLKTAESGDPYRFERKGRGFGYDLQAAFYCHVYELATGKRPAGFRFVTVEGDAPHLVDVHEPTDWLDIGEAKRKLATSLYLDCMTTNKWPGRPAVINRISSPDWALQEEDIEV